MTLLRLEQDGTIQTQYADNIGDILRGMGPLNVHRASKVEFDNALQGWLVEMLENTDLGISPFRVGPFQQRTDALRWEVDYIQSRLSGLSDAEACKQAAKERRV